MVILAPLPAVYNYRDGQKGKASIYGTSRECGGGGGWRSVTCSSSLSHSQSSSLWAHTLTLEVFPLCKAADGDMGAGGVGAVKQLVVPSFDKAAGPTSW